METHLSLQRGEFFPDCPYFQKASAADDYFTLPMCRLIETFEDGSTFIADSFGDHDWIDITKARPCGRSCRCNQFGADTEERVFAFTVMKTPTKINILFHDMHLRDDVIAALTPTTRKLPSGKSVWNGFLLREYRSLLAARLRHMQKPRYPSPWDNFRVAVLWLLINGILYDPQIFTASLLQSCRAGFRNIDPLDCFEQSHTKSRGERTGYIKGRIGGNKRRMVGFGSLSRNSWIYTSYIPHGNAEPQAIEIVHEPVQQRAIELPPNDAFLPLNECDQDAAKQNRDAELRNAIESGNIVKVQNILQDAIGSILDDENHPRSNRRAQYNTQIDNETLMLAVRKGCIHSTKLLLIHGYDVNCEPSTESHPRYGPPIATPLSLAAVCGSDSLVRLLLRYDANVPVATLILQDYNSDLWAINRIKSLARDNAPNIVQKRFKYDQNFIRLRNNFWKEHALMDKAATDSQSFAEGFYRAASDISLHIEPWNIKSFTVEKNVHLAWNTAFATMRGLCNGKAPNNVHEILLFLALVKSMAPIIDESGGQNLETEFFDDLSRWQLLFHQDEQELGRFIAAVKAIWSIDVTQTRQDRLEDTSHFEVELLHIQDLARRLVIQADSVFQTSPNSEPGLLNVQAKWRARQATAEEPIHYRMQDDTHLSLTNYHNPLPPEINEADKSIPPGRVFMNEIPQLIESPSALDPVLVMVLAGTIFAMILAFLLLLRSSTYSSTVKGLFPLATVPAADSSGIVICYQTHIIRRTRELLGLYLGSSTSTTHEDVMSSGQGESSQQNTGSAEPTDNGGIDQASSPGSSSISNESGPSSETSRTRPKRSSSAPVKKTFCDDCNRDFGTTSNLGKHNRDMHEKVRYLCQFPPCRKTYQRKDMRMRHERMKHWANSLSPSRVPRAQG
ncbi:hypothetical protein GGR58DRAFT_504048 [Xylaria digitata]|nr:hypothetical protein GGR58DRAFT_504048 [Xylaria digitata]